MSTALALLLAYVFIALGNVLNDGFYLLNALILLLVGFGFLTAAFVWASRGHRFDEPAPEEKHLTYALIFLLVISTAFSVDMFARSPFIDPAYRAWVALLALLVAAAYLLLAKRLPKARTAVFALAVAGAIGFAIWMPIAAPTPTVDAYNMAQESARNLLDGKNPYATPVTATGDTAYGYDLQAYTYLPGDLYLQTISYALTGDVRWITVLSVVIVAFVLFKLARRRWGTTVAQLACLLYLYNPRGLYVIEQAWIDPLILMLFAGFMLARESERAWLASAANGYMLFMKQTMVFAFFQSLVVERRWKHVALVLGVGIATVLPFAIADFSAFWSNAIMFNVTLPFRDDALTIWGFIYETFGIQPPPFWSLGVGIVLAVVTALPLRRMDPLRGYLFALAATLFGVFVFGSQAFANYYHFIGVIVLFVLVLAGAAPASEPVGQPGETAAA